MSSSTPTSCCSEKSVYFDAPLAPMSMINGTPPSQPRPDDAPPASPFTTSNGIGTHNNLGQELVHQSLDNTPQGQPLRDQQADQGYTSHPNESTGWLPATDSAPEPSHKRGSILKPSASLSRSSRRGGSLRDRPRSTSLSRAGSVKSLTPSEATFSHGPGTQPLGAGPEDNEEIINRAATANDALTSKQKSKILKAEAKDSKRLSRIIKEEGKVEKASLSVAIDELVELQKIQRSAVKNEAKSFAEYTKLRSAYQKLENNFIAARTRYEAAQAQLDAEAEALETWRGTAREATDRMHEKSKEVESLRALYGLDEREREVRLSQLTGKKRSWL